MSGPNSIASVANRVAALDADAQSDEFEAITTDMQKDKQKKQLLNSVRQVGIDSVNQNIRLVEKVSLQ